MFGVRPIVVSLAAVLAFPATGMSEVITFQNRSIDLLINAGPQTEAGFTYQATVGQGWEVITQIGNPPSSLVTFFNNQGSNVGDIVNITRTGGGQFTFDSVDFRTILASGSDDVQITGFLGANPVGVLNLTNSSLTFLTVPSGFANLIDRLQIRVSASTGNALLLDNFVLTPAGVGAAEVPEPASIVALALAGVGLVGTRLRRGRKAVESPVS